MILDNAINLNSRINTKQLFFALASAWATIGPLLFMLSYFALIDINISIATHGRSMLFGFTSALITGYLGGKRPTFEVLWLGLLWLGTRGAEIVGVQQTICLYLYSIYGLHLAIIVAPKFLSAKKIRNWLMSPTLLILTGFPVLLLLFNSHSISRNELTFVFAQLLTLLMFFMAGRMIVPLVIKSHAQHLCISHHRVQPNLEGIVIGLIFVSTMIKVIDFGQFISLHKYVLVILQTLIGTVILLRLYRWNPFAIPIKSGVIWALFSGYTWLAISQLVMAAHLVFHQSNISSLHLLTIGALGIMASSIMTYSLQKKSKVSKSYWLYILCFSSAAIFRYLASESPLTYSMALWISTGLWTLAFSTVLFEIIHSKKSLSR